MQKVKKVDPSASSRHRSRTFLRPYDPKGGRKGIATALWVRGGSFPQVRSFVRRRLKCSTVCQLGRWFMTRNGTFLSWGLAYFPFFDLHPTSRTRRQGPNSRHRSMFRLNLGTHVAVLVYTAVLAHTEVRTGRRREGPTGLVRACVHVSKICFRSVAPLCSARNVGRRAAAPPRGRHDARASQDPNVMGRGRMSTYKRRHR